MKYQDYLKKRHPCPFCHSRRHFVHHTTKAYITYSLAPYHKHHMLVIPKRHVVSYEKLHAQEEKEISELIKVGISILNHLGYRDYSILVRNGKKIGKTINHLHYHLIPKAAIISLPESAPKEMKEFVRDILTPKQIKQTVDDLKEAFNKIS
ncbi:MAG TPA: HIT domain-containing protein [Candidatus Gracilibacteria bacterium]|nr:HIT domain-containing protein [Candidatus Gracilibacteria bacterium]HRY91104.1 HIT domain-containing protein [Candidatus Gracilibacteria bacterium]